MNTMKSEVVIKGITYRSKNKFFISFGNGFVEIENSNSYHIVDFTELTDFEIEEKLSTIGFVKKVNHE